MSDFLVKLQHGTEKFLTLRKRRKMAKREKQRKKNPILDWIEAFLWAAFVVLLINQYLLQAYQIPSGSMTDTLLIKDRIFVNKLVYGPELLPGLLKLPGFADPKRGEVIIFENPSYISKGPVFDLVQRILYMVTLSFVDIDRDEQGNPKAHFLIKRAVGFERDRLRFREGELEVMPEGELRWIPEREFTALSGISYPVRRLIKPEEYDAFYKAGKASAYQDLLLPVSEELKKAMAEADNHPYADGFAFDYERTKTLYSINPQEKRYGVRLHRYDAGWYIPEGFMFPLGDNRDNSRDARYFGAVKLKKVLGKAMFRYWPLSRLGGIH